MTTTTVTPSTWYAVMKAAKPGDAIQFGPGSYGDMKWGSGVPSYGWPVAAPGVTVTFDPAAVISSIALWYCSGWRLVGPLDIAMTSGTAVGCGFAAYNSSDISLTNATIHQADNTTMTGVGFMVRNSPNCSITYNKVHHVGTGGGVTDSENVLVQGNSFHHVGEGVDHAGSPGVKVFDNTGTDFYPTPGAHPDFLQFWQTAAHPKPAGAHVEGNTFHRGAGGIVQGIFVETQQQMKIIDNTLVGTMYNGISLSGCDDVEIADNYVKSFPDMGTRIIVRGASSNVTVHDNAADAVINYTDTVGPNVNYVATNNRLPGQPFVAAPTVAAGPDPLQATVDTLTAQVADLKAQLAAALAKESADVAAIQAQLTTAQDQLSAAQTKIDNATAALR